jgi:31-O-methyltransferase
MSNPTVPAPAAEDLSPMRLPNGQVVMQLNPAETSLQYRSIVNDRSYLRHGVRLSPGATVLDVGANIGIAALAFHWECPDVRVYAFEPTHPLYEALAWNYAAYRIAGAAFDYGLSERPGTAVITLYPETTAMSSLYADASHDAEVTRTFLHNSGFDDADVADMSAGRHVTCPQPCLLRTVSQVLAEHDIETVDLLKVNVEKAERDVLAGIDDADWPRIRQVVGQVHDIGGRLDTVREEMTRRGFSVVCDQDALLDGTDIYDMYAWRSGT